MSLPRLHVVLLRRWQPLQRSGRAKTRPCARHCKRAGAGPGNYFNRNHTTLPMAQRVTIAEMIAYSNKYTEDLKKLIAEGDSEPWMHEGIRITNAIVHVLESVDKLPIWFDSREDEKKQFNEDLIGQLIRQRLTITHQIDELTHRVEGARHPESIAGYVEELEKCKEALAWTLQSLREAKLRHKLHLQQRLAAVLAEAESPGTELVDEVDLKHLAEDITKKIEVLDNELKTI